MNFKIVARLFSFILLMLYLSNSFATIVAGAFFKHPQTGQRISFLGDLHFTTSYTVEQNAFIYSALQAMVFENTQLKVFFEGMVGEGAPKEVYNAILPDPQNILWNLTALSDTLSSNFINIQNREFLRPLYVLEELMLLLQLSASTAKQQGKPVEQAENVLNYLEKDYVKIFFKSPLKCFFDKVVELRSQLYERTRENLVITSALRHYKYQEDKKITALLDFFYEKFKEYFNHSLLDLAKNQEFLQLYFKFLNDTSVLQTFEAICVSFQDINCLVHILEHKKSCVVVAGLLHIEKMKEVLLQLGFECIMQSPLRLVNKKNYNSLIELMNDVEVKNKLEAFKGKNETRGSAIAAGRDLFSQLLPIEVDIVKRIMAYNNLNVSNT